MVHEELKRRSLLLKINCFKKFVAKDNWVYLDRFGKMMDLYGPMFDDKCSSSSSSEGSSAAVGCHQMLDRMFSMVNEPWFYGDTSEDEAWEVLKNEALLTFLVRFSATTNNFVVSAVVERNREKCVAHFRVKRTEFGYSMPPSSALYAASSNSNASSAPPIISPTLEELLRTHSGRLRRPPLQTSKYHHLTVSSACQKSVYVEEPQES